MKRYKIALSGEKKTINKTSKSDLYGFSKVKKKKKLKSWQQNKYLTA